MDARWPLQEPSITGPDPTGGGSPRPTGGTGGGWPLQGPSPRPPGPAVRTLADQIRSGATSVAAVVEGALAAAQVVPNASSFVAVTPASAMASAAERDRELKRGRCRGPLHGIPICVKDNIDIRGLATTCGSRALRDAVAQDTATVVRRLTAAGCVVIGKTQMYEMAYGPHVTSLGVPCNPVDSRLVTGGSSSGSACVIGAGVVPAGIGTDTGGSVRVPAACCGLAGLKPTHGALPCDGVVPLAASLDDVGPLGQTVEDVEVLFEAMADRRVRQRVYGRRDRRPGRSDRTGDLRGVTVGLLEVEPPCPTEAAARAAVQAAGAACRDRGARLVAGAPLPLPELQAAHRLILTAEAFVAHRSLLQRARDTLEPATWGRLTAGGMVLAQDLLRAQSVRRIARTRLSRALRDVDVLLLPTLPCLPPRADDDRVRLGENTHRFTEVFTSLTFLANLTGCPALAVPFGRHDGRPASVQLLGPPYSESTLFRVGAALEG